jgi:hypothetical protein
LDARATNVGLNESKVAGDTALVLNHEQAA